MVLLALGGCKDKDDASPGDSGPMTTSEAWQDVVPFSKRTGNDGLLELEVEVGADHTALLLTATSKDAFVAIERVIDPDGAVALTWEDWWFNETESLTDAFFGWEQTMAFNWPVRSEDGPLREGTWTLEFASLTANSSYVNSKLEGAVYLKADGDLDSGVVPVHIAYTKNAGKPKIRDAVEVGVERWSEVWATHGLTLEAHYVDTDLPDGLDFGYEGGSTQVQELAETLPPAELLVVVGESIDNDDFTFGLAGGIPGTLAPTKLTWVLVSWLAHAGPDGVFLDEEKRMMGETMAHEVGHYSGLYHPVECPYDCVESYDALVDTPACVGWVDCEDQLGTNLMFPYAVCDFDGCWPTGDISADQLGVWNRYTGTH